MASDTGQVTRLPIGLNSSGDWVCTGCGGGIEVDEQQGDVVDISQPATTQPGIVTMAAWQHTPDCPVIRQVRTGR